MSSTGSPHSSSALPSAPVGILTPLPEIRSRQIRKRVFTHSSLAGENRYEFQAPESDPCTDNEELAQIGDQAFGLAVTDLIQDLYPHLRVGRASKVRDHIKRKDLIAEICVSYRLHKRVNLPERQADSLRDSKNVQVNVFKAYVGGLYRDQGLEVVRKWIISVVQPHVEAAYQSLRNDYLPVAIPLSRVPTVPHPSPPSSSTSLESTAPASPSRPARDPGVSHRNLRPRTHVSQQGSRRAGGSIENRPKDVDKSRNNHKRRRSSQGDGRSGDPDRTSSSRCKRGSDGSERESKRQRC